MNDDVYMLKDTGHGPRKKKGAPIPGGRSYILLVYIYKYKNTIYFLFCVVLKISILKNMPTKLLEWYFIRSSVHHIATRLFFPPKGHVSGTVPNLSRHSP